MLYQPTFCCNCGNKIERIKWNLLTSRRFCENCESEFRKEEWLPLIISSAVLLFSGLFVFGSYLKTPEKPLSLTKNGITTNSNEKPQDRTKREFVNANSAKTVEQAQVISANRNDAQNKAGSSAKVASFPPLQNEENTPVYFCGAQTKKGTACIRKVKGGGRCWQHMGQVSMLPKDKLIAGR